MRPSTVKKYVPTLREQAVASRAMTFPNRRQEREALGEVDHQINLRLRHLEGLLVGHARAFNEAAKALRVEADEVRAELRSMEFALLDGDEVNLERWAVLDAQARSIRAKAQHLPNQFFGHFQRLSDVLAYSEQLQQKYPALYRPVVLPEGQI